MRIRIFLFLLLTNLFIFPLIAQDSGARWALESTQAVVGESLVLTLEVQGTDTLDVPNFTVPGIEILFQGGSPRNSTSIVSVNGKTTKTVRKSWVGSWTLKSSAVGRYHLDAQRVSIGGQTVLLSALDWEVGAARNDNRFFLQQGLSQSACVPGIEIEYSLDWYISESAQNPEFTISILDNPDFIPVESSFTGVPATNGDVFQIQYHGRVLTGVKSIVQKGGQQYTKLSFKFKVKPVKPGRYDFGNTMVCFEGAVGTRPSQDFFGNTVQQPLYSTLVAQAQSLTLLVKDLPTQGKPNPFSGLIGTIALSWDGGQGVYSVGDPIRLVLKLSGVQNKPNLDLDHMVLTAFKDADFQVSSDLSAAETEGQRSFVFRARKPGRLTIPSMTLNYYDSDKERYAQTATKALVFDIKGNASIPYSSSPETAGNLPDTTQNKNENLSPSSNTSLARMNPNGLERSLLPSVPFWVFSLPGLITGILVSLSALWRHSLRRKIFVERKEWRKNLIPLSATQGRQSLEEGRRQMNLLLSAGDHWKEVLHADGRWEYFCEKIKIWDQAFFADSRDNENWVSRWEELRQTMENWK